MYLAFFIVCLLLLVLFIKYKIVLESNNDSLKVFVVIFKVIKFKLIDKTKFEIKKPEVNPKTGIPPLKVVLRIVKANIENLKELLSKFRLHVDLSLEFGLAYPDRTAIMYGFLNFLIYNLGEAMNLFLNRYTGSYSIIPDFENKRIDFKVHSEISFRIFALLIPGIKSLIIYFKYIRKYRKEGGELNARSSDRRVNENYNG